MAATAKVVTKLPHLKIGQIVQRSGNYPERLKVRILKMKLDKYLTKYYNRREDIWVLEKDVKGGVGDVVMIRKLNEVQPPNISYELYRQVFKLGEITDPVTGRRCRGREFIDEESRELTRIEMAQNTSER